MALCNRLAVTLVAAFILVGAVVVLLVASEAVDSDFLPGGSEKDAWFQPQLEDLADYGGTGEGIAIGVSAGIGLLMLAALFFEIRPLLHRREVLLPISGSPDGNLNIEAGSVRLLAEKTGIANRSVASLKCRLRIRRGATSAGPASVVIVCQPRLILGSNVQEIGDDLQVRIKEAVQRLTGLTVLRVDVSRVRFVRGDDTRLIDS